MHVDEVCVAVHDKYPKSRVHGLVISRDPSLDGIGDLRPKHLPVLQHMREVGEAWFQQHCQSLEPSLRPTSYKMGFHTLPSMRQLHLHVVSLDFDSPCLKHKTHWNSFTTAFFRQLDSVVEELQSNGQVRQAGWDFKLLHLCLTPAGWRGALPSLSVLRTSTFNFDAGS